MIGNKPPIARMSHPRHLPVLMRVRQSPPAKDQHRGAGRSGHKLPSIWITEKVAQTRL